MAYLLLSWGGGIDNSQVINDVGTKSLDAVQNNPTFPDSLRQGLNAANGQIDNLFKMVQASGWITGDANWNNYKTAGTYKVQDANMTAENNAPVGMFKYGILSVLVSETTNEKRTLQIYYPQKPFQNSNIVMVIRSYNSHPTSGESWTPWFAISGTQWG